MTFKLINIRLSALVGKPSALAMLGHTLADPAGTML